MRTTLNVDDDVLLAAREIAGRRGTSVGKALSDLARLSLSDSRQLTTRNGVPVVPVQVGAQVVSLDLIRRLLDDEV